MELKPGYKQTEVGVIPGDWSVIPVGQAFDICNNLRLPISQAVRKKMVGPFPYYGPTNIQGYINEYRVEGEYALIGEDGDHFLKWKDQAMTQLVCGRFNVNNHAHLIKGTKNITAWFYYYFFHRDLTPYLTRQGAGRFKLTKRMLFTIPCAIPKTQTEQEAIAKALSDVDALIRALDQLIAKKRDLKQAAMQQLLTGHTRLPGFIGEWRVKRLGDFTGIRNLKVLPSNLNPDTPCVELEQIGQGSGRLLDISTARYSTSSKYSFLKGDVLFGRLRSYLRKFWHADRDGICSTEIWPLMVDPEQVFSSFLHAIVQTDRFIQEASISYGTHMPRADWGVMQNFEVLIPHIDEQTAIAQVLSDMDAEIEALEARRDKTALLKQGTMQELLTGKTRLT